MWVYKIQRHPLHSNRLPTMTPEELSLTYEMFEDHCGIRLLIDPEDGKILKANKAAIDFYGYPKSRLESMKIFEINLQPGEDLRRDMLKAKDNRQNHFLFQHKTADGSLKQVEVYTFGMPFEGREVLYSGVSDVTDVLHLRGEKLVLDEELKEKNLLLEALLEATQVGCWKWKVKTGELQLDRKWASMLGYELEELLPTNFETWRRLVHPDDEKRTIEALQRYFDGRVEFFDVDFRLKHKKGKWAWIQSKAKVVEWSPECEPLTVIGTHFDITKERELAHRLTAERERLEHLNSSREKLFSVFSHDIKNALNGILGVADLMNLSIEQKNYSELTSYLSMLTNSTSSSVSLLENLLHWSRIQKEDVTLNIRTVDLKIVFEKVISLLDSNLQTKKLKIALDLPPNAIVKADEFMLEVILRNLISNAIKYSFQKGEIRIIAKREDGFTTISIRDNGVGIPEAEKPYILDAPRIRSRNGTAKEKGTGIGLILCKNYVAQQGGSIWFESEDNLGTTFYFTLRSA
jgi:PAS domain S-box-containing protein